MKHLFPFSGLGRRLSVLTSVLILLTATMNIAQVSLRELYRDLARLELTGANLAEMIAANAEFAVYTQNVETLQQVLRAAGRTRSLEQAEVWTLEENLLATLRPRAASLGSLDVTADTPTAQVPPARSILPGLPEGETLVFSAPIFGIGVAGTLDPFDIGDAPAWAVIGQVRIRLTTHHLRQHLFEQGVQTILSSGLLLLLGLGLTVLITLRITQPIQQLTEQADRIAGGDLEQAIPLVGEHEIGALARSLRSMVTHLRISREQLTRRGEDLEREKARLAQTLRSIEDGVLSLDQEGRILLVNPSACNLLDAPETELLGKPLSQVLQLRDDAGDLLPAERLHELHREADEGDRELRGHLLRDPAPPLLLTVHAAPLLRREGEDAGCLVVIRDVTDRERLEEERLRGSKLESLGILAGGIAHDFNNLLTVLVGNLSLAREELPEGETRELVVSGEQAALRAQELTSQLLTFARGGEPVRTAQSVPQLVEEAIRLSLSGSRTACEVDLPEDLPPVEVDAGQIGQVLRNLLINANQAMPDGGRVFLRATRRVARPDNEEGLEPGGFVVLEVRDEGCGIPPENLERIFDPYFTSKETGTGLGLATSYSVMRKHQGYLGVRSKPGAGATFTVWLPESRAQPGQEETESPQVATGPRRVLVMDDEPGIRELVRRILVRRGHRVDMAADGAETLRLYGQAQEAGDPFDLVLLDLTIPGGMGGEETNQRLLEEFPGARTVVSSGYSEDQIMAKHRDFGFRGMVRKPYRARDLLQVLEEVCSGS